MKPRFSSVRYYVNLILIFTCILLTVMPACAKASTVPLAQQLIRAYGSGDSRQIPDLLAQIDAIDHRQGHLWNRISQHWAYFHEEMDISQGILPDDLPEDDSLCIVVLGYQLNADGSMQPELQQRLEVALASAEKYPNAYIALTGGKTAGEALPSEAEVMAQWLKDQGISPQRLILESKSYDTTYNAVNTYATLVRQYPGVTGIALISSDYHLPWGATLFQTVCDYTEVYGKTVIPVLACAGNGSDYTFDSMAYQLRGICTITGIPYPGK